MKKNEILVVAQARVGSSRLPYKSLLRIGGYAFLELVLLRIMRAKLIDEVIAAIPASPENDVLEALAQSLGIKCVRGPEDDVLGRCVLAAREKSGCSVIRVCCDNPLVAPEALDALASVFDARVHDLLQNVRRSSGYPDGLGAEIFSADCLSRLNLRATNPEDREHVTLFAYHHPEEFRVGEATAPDHWCAPDLRLDIDYEADYEAMCQFVAKLGGDPVTATIEEIIHTARNYPQLLEKRHNRFNT